MNYFFPGALAYLVSSTTITPAISMFAMATAKITSFAWRIFEKIKTFWRSLQWLVATISLAFSERPGLTFPKCFEYRDSGRYSIFFWIFRLGFEMDFYLEIRELRFSKRIFF